MMRFQSPLVYLKFLLMNFQGQNHFFFLNNTRNTLYIGQNKNQGVTLKRLIGMLLIAQKLDVGA